MIVYSNGGGTIKGTDNDGDAQPISVVGADQNELRVADEEQRDILNNLVKEMMIMNIHLSSITDLMIDREEMEV